MPSGFQNDTNQLQAEMYRATITMSNTTYYPTADGDDNGGVTPSASDSFATLPTTLAKGKARARGNMRFRNVVNRLTGLGDCQIRDITISEANGDAQATSLAFTIAYERPALITVSGTAVDASTAITTTALAMSLPTVVDPTAVPVSAINAGRSNATVNAKLVACASPLASVIEISRI